MSKIYEITNEFIIDFIEIYVSDTETQEYLKETWKISKLDLELLLLPEIKKLKSKKKSKKPKDAPKNPKSSYIFFCQDKRSEIKENNPEFLSKDIMRELGRLWKNTTEEDKIKYIDLASNDKERYKEEIKNYVPSEVSSETNSEVSSYLSKKTKIKSKDSPKNPKSAYIFFSLDVREEIKKENPDILPKDILKKVGELWKEIKNTKKEEKYKNLAIEDKKRFEKEMVLYEKNQYIKDNNDEKNIKKEKVTKKKEKSIEKISVENLTEIVKDIIDNHEEKSITKKIISDKLKEKGIKNDKEDLNKIIDSLDEDN